ncbi:MAG: HD domain-containing protein [Erysipelotrichaceae bacterium]|nr:HD domain-containing protein [Erysipelotrichaceae bacterium]
MIDEAIRFAAEAHKDMVRKGNGQPYIFHPLEVLSLVSLMTLDDEVLCAAILHDTVEDTDTTIRDIREQFGERVAAMVAYESEDKRGQVNKKETWYERKKETIDTISRLTDEGAKMVCLADKVSNLRSFHLGLLDQGEKFWENFNQSDPKMHYWYYDSLRKALSSLSDKAVYKEYCFLIETIFKKYMQEQIE